MKVTQFFPRTDIVVNGSNPESADITNPRGLCYGFAAYVVANTERGDRRELYVATSQIESDVMADAAKLADALNARLALGKLPVAFNTWLEGRPAYASDAYSSEDEIALERREAEEEAWAA